MAEHEDQQGHFVMGFLIGGGLGALAGVGLTPQKALFATAHKLIRVIFAMLSQRTYFKVREA